MNVFYFAILLFVSVVGCTDTKPDQNENVVAEINGKKLYKTDLLNLLPSGTTANDSLLITSNYIKKWLTEELILDIAKKNLTSKQDEIDRLVAEYKNSLLKYRYQEMLVNEKLSAQITEQEMTKYWDENQTDFLLVEDLIKGLFLKIPIDAPNLAKIKKLYKSNSESAIEDIEKYSIQYAINYEYFYDNWVDFNDIENKLPVKITNQSNYLKNNKFIEMQDSAYVYLVNIKELLPKGSVEPLEHAKPKIHELLINKRRVNFLRDFENELYNKAILDGKAHISE